jgi:hypothetical protein
MATLRLIRSVASACRMVRLSASCPMVTAAVEYPAAIWASACRTSAAVSSRSLRAPMTFRIGSGTFWFWVIVVAERPSSGQQLGRHVGDFVFGHFGPAGSRPR